MIEGKIEGLEIHEGSTFQDTRGSFSRLYDSDWFANLELKRLGGS